MKKKTAARFEFLTGDTPYDELRETIVFIHGACINSYFWLNQIDSLDKEVNVVSIDLPGRCGFDSPEYSSVSKYAEYVLDFITEQNYKNSFICGVSMGGAIVIDILLNNPGFVKGGIIINSGARLKVRELVYDSIKKDFKAFKKAMMELGISSKSSAEDILKYTDRVTIENSETAIRDFDACAGFDLMEELHRINKKTLVMTASEDTAAPVKYGEYLRDNIKNAEYVKINNAGHLSPLESPESVNIEILKFIKKTA